MTSTCQSQNQTGTHRWTIGRASTKDKLRTWKLAGEPDNDCTFTPHLSGSRRNASSALFWQRISALSMNSFPLQVNTASHTSQNANPRPLGCLRGRSARVPVVSGPWVPFRVLVGHDRSERLHHARGREVFRRDQLQSLPLAILLHLDDVKKFWIDLFQICIAQLGPGDMRLGIVFFEPLVLVAVVRDRLQAEFDRFVSSASSRHHRRFFRTRSTFPNSRWIRLHPQLRRITSLRSIQPWRLRSLHAPELRSTSCVPGRGSFGALRVRSALLWHAWRFPRVSCTSTDASKLARVLLNRLPAT